MNNEEIKDKLTHLERMADLKDHSDTEKAHTMADDILCDFLRGLGYDDLVDAYEAVDKWFA